MTLGQEALARDCGVLEQQLESSKIWCPVEISNSCCNLKVEHMRFLSRAFQNNEIKHSSCKSSNWRNKTYFMVMIRTNNKEDSFWHWDYAGAFSPVPPEPWLQTLMLFVHLLSLLFSSEACAKLIRNEFLWFKDEISQLSDSIKNVFEASTLTAYFVHISKLPSTI
jgi:hypothetical protein